METSATFAALFLVFTELPTFAPVCAFAAIVAVVAEIIFSPILDSIRAEIVVHIAVVGVVHTAVPDAVVIPAAAPPISPTVPHIRTPPAVVGAAIPAGSAPRPAERPIEQAPEAAEVDIDIFPGAAASSRGTAARVAASVIRELLLLDALHLADLLVKRGQSRPEDNDKNDQDSGDAGDIFKKVAIGFFRHQAKLKSARVAEQ